MFRSLLIANRGEIARRIGTVARSMGLRTIAVYSDADADAPFVKEADQAVRLGPPPPKDSYLNVEALIRARTPSSPGPAPRRARSSSAPRPSRWPG